MVEKMEDRLETTLQALECLVLWSEQRFQPARGWEALQITDVERLASLHVFLRCVGVNHRICDAVVNTPSFAACKVAQHDINGAPHQKPVKIHSIEENLSLFSRSWILQVEMAPRLSSCSFSELDLEDLLQLRRCLQAGWPTDYPISRVGGSMANSGVWGTPLLR